MDRGTEGQTENMSRSGLCPQLRPAWRSTLKELGLVTCDANQLIIYFFLVSLLPVNKDATVLCCQWEAFVFMGGLKSSLFQW